MKPEETINSEYYCQELEEIHQKLSNKMPAVVNTKGSILLHINARSHVLKTVIQKLNKLEYETLPHIAYSSDLALTDFRNFKHH
uniref:DOPA 4,5-dioxygenase n=1 Tax=Strongyloides venezuelensis TaxID=75913 RepID=A0A0K0FAS2_STRVS